MKRNPTAGRLAAATILALLSVVCLSASVHAKAGGESEDGVRVKWKNGLRIEDPSGPHKVKIGGRIMNDWAFMGEDADIRSAFGKLKDGTEFRRARLFVSGTLWEHLLFKSQYDFGGGEAEFKDMYMGLTGLPCVGTLLAGRFKEPFSISELTSSKYGTFLERSLLTVFAPSRQTGIMARNHTESERMTWAVGVFRSADDFGDSVGGGAPYDLTGRITFLPLYEDEGQKLVHVGLAYSHLFRNDFETSYATEPEAHLAPDLADTGDFDSNDQDLGVAEVALVWGSFSAQAESVVGHVRVSGAPDSTLWGATLEASYFLTGEHREYETDVAEFGRTKPSAPLDIGGGDSGAWQVAARVSYLDLDDESIMGGRLLDITGGVNWYLYSNCRVMFNYVYARVLDVGSAHIGQMRFQIDF